MCHHGDSVLPVRTTPAALDNQQMRSSSSSSSSVKRSRDADVSQQDRRNSRARVEPASDGPPTTAAAQQLPLGWGCHFSIGRRDHMEDAHLTDKLIDVSSESGARLFGVFDGHGGCTVSDFLAQNTEAFVERALRQHKCKAEGLKQAFVSLDASLPATETGGSTALLVMVDKDVIMCANAGDSRAVLSRGGQPVALSNDHKPDREDEEVRIQQAGGQVINNGGARRVMGVLSMSRAIGDKWLQQYGVTPEPEVSAWARQADDEFVILASDGLWDALSNDEAIKVARRCLQRATSKGASRTAAASIAAKVLVRVATDRGSRDNITVIVVDLQKPSPNRDASGIPACESVCSAPIKRRHSDPNATSGFSCSSDPNGWALTLPRLLSAERLSLLVSASSAPLILV